jgi:hypothetical protein
MPKILSFLTILFITALPIRAQQYSDFFTSQACRIDFNLCGDQKHTATYLAKVHCEPAWGGRQNHLSESLNLGEYQFQVRDSVTGQIIYTEGFSSLFNEWQSTAEAMKMHQCFEQSIRFPFPKKTVKFTIQKRVGFNAWDDLLTIHVNPADKLIKKNQHPAVEVKKIHGNLPSEKAIDIAVIAEGYNRKEMKQFYKDAMMLAESLFSHEPFKQYKDRFNVYAIAAVSQDSGVSMPHINRWRNTAVNAHFHTFYEPRYLTSSETFKIRNYAAQVPYDAVFELVNTPLYGGGGIFNSLTIASARSKRALTQVIVHEFGHGFAGLGDEYFYDQDALGNLYDITKEPWEPNITTLVQFDTKWREMLPSGTVIPTPVGDSIPKPAIGVFEGGGYRKKGIYRPAYDCRMRTNNAPGFCPVCQKAVEKMILYLTE